MTVLQVDLTLPIILSSFVLYHPYLPRAKQAFIPKTADTDFHVKAILRHKFAAIYCRTAQLPHKSILIMKSAPLHQA
jgi:hypothetical protein